jgi:hypothetical protein
MSDCNGCLNCIVKAVGEKEYSEIFSKLSGSYKSSKVFKNEKKRQIVYCSKGYWNRPYLVLHDQKNGRVFYNKFGEIIISKKISLQECEDEQREDEECQA